MNYYDEFYFRNYKQNTKRFARKELEATLEELQLERLSKCSKCEIITSLVDCRCFLDSPSFNLICGLAEFNSDIVRCRILRMIGDRIKELHLEKDVDYVFGMIDEKK